MKEWSLLKKGLIIAAVSLFGLGAIGSQHNNSQISPPTTSPPPQTTDNGGSTITPIKLAPITNSSLDNSTDTESTTDDTGTSDTGIDDTNLSIDNTYTNMDGTTVHSPAYSTDGSVPAGASALCGDGTYSFSQHARGTCSYHGGVAQWL